MNPEHNAQIIELPQSKYGPRRSRKEAKCLPAHHLDDRPEQTNLAAKLVELKEKRRRLDEEIKHIQEKLRDSAFELKVELAQKGKRISRINHPLPDLPGQPMVQIQTKNQFRQVDVTDYPNLFQDIGPVAYEAFIKEKWIAKTLPGFTEGDFLDSIILGVSRLLGDDEKAQDVGWWVWNKITSTWLTFDVKLAVVSKDFDFKIGAIREKMSESEIEGMNQFIKHAMYKAAVVTKP